MKTMPLWQLLITKLVATHHHLEATQWHTTVALWQLMQL